jgi:hypothetical protein
MDNRLSKYQRSHLITQLRKPKSKRKTKRKRINKKINKKITKTCSASLDAKTLT